MYSKQKWLPRYPLLAVTLLFSLGIVLQSLCRLAWNPTLILMGGASLAWMIIAWKTLQPPWPIAPWVVTAGAILAAAQWMKLEGSEPDDIGRIVLRLPQHASVRGVIWTDPTMHVLEESRRSGKKKADDADDETGPHAVRADFELKVSAVNFQTVWEPASGRVQVRVKREIQGNGKADCGGDIEFGREIEVEGVLAEPAATRNFGLFDYKGWLARKGIHHVMQAEGAGSLRAIGWGTGGQWVFKARQKLAERLTRGIEGDTLAVGIIRGMLLGYREDIPRDVNDSFRRTGTLHVFAISGSHITLIALALLIVLKQMRVPQRWASLVVMPLLVFYVVATGLCASAVRSLVMAGLVIVGWSLLRPSALLNNLAAAALIILAWDPLQLFDPGFQLSFVVVTALILMTPWVDKKIRSWIEPDPYIPRSHVPKWRLAILQPCRWVGELVAVCLAAWVGSLGLNVYYFNLVSFVSIVANMLIVPLASASVALGMTSLLLGLAWDQIGITLNATHALLIHAMVAVSESLSGWRLGYFYVAQPPVPWVVACYALGTLAVALALRGRKRWAMGTGLGLLVLVAGSAASVWMSSRVRLDVLDVGAGQAVLVTGPQSERVLLDAGSRYQARMSVEPFLRSRGVNAIDLVVISHGDAAHYGGLAELMRSVPIRRVAVADADFRSKSYRRLLDDLRQSGIPVETWCAGQARTLRSGQWDVLWPAKNLDYKRADDLCLVLELKHGEKTILFAGDLGEQAEEIVGGCIQHPCTALVQGIASDGISLTEAWLEALKPETIILNTAEFPLKAYPSPELQERLKQAKSKVYRTDESGGVILEMEAGVLVSRSFIGGKQ